MYFKISNNKTVRKQTKFKHFRREDAQRQVQYLICLLQTQTNLFLARANYIKKLTFCNLQRDSKFVSNQNEIEQQKTTTSRRCISSSDFVLSDKQPIMYGFWIKQ